eukprot:9482274-Alexandrium_andersonii.AAC.1
MVGPTSAPTNPAARCQAIVLPAAHSVARSAARCGAARATPRGPAGRSCWPYAFSKSIGATTLSLWPDALA